MASKKAKTPKNKPERTGRAVNAWLNADLWAAFERYLSSLEVRPTTTAALETAIQSWLSSKGFWPPKE